MRNVRAWLVGSVLGIQVAASLLVVVSRETDRGPFVWQQYSTASYPPEILAEQLHGPVPLTDIHVLRRAEIVVSEPFLACLCEKSRASRLTVRVPHRDDIAPRYITCKGGAS